MKLGRLRIDCDTPGAEVSVDGKTVGSDAVARTCIWATPGPHQVTASPHGCAPALETVWRCRDTGSNDASRGPWRLIPLVAPAPVPVALAPPPDSMHCRPRRLSVRRQAARRGLVVGQKCGRGSQLARRCYWRRRHHHRRLDEIQVRQPTERRFMPRAGTTGPALAAAQSDTSTRQFAPDLWANVFLGLTAAAAVTTGCAFYFEGRPVGVAPFDRAR